MNSRASPKTAVVTKSECHTRNYFKSQIARVTERDNAAMSHGGSSKELKTSGKLNERDSVTTRDKRNMSHGVSVTTKPHP